MIEKERLEQIIKENKDFWWLQPYGDSFIVREIKLPRVKVVIKEKYCVLIENDKEYLAEFEHLTEDKESAYEFAEFGNITRTERLELPSWEDVKDTGYDEIFFIKDNRFDSGVVQYYFLVAEQTKEIQIMFREIEHIMTTNAYDVIFDETLTRENYNEARRLCVKLFKGEEV